jgi:putative oxidoreductase
MQWLGKYRETGLLLMRVGLGVLFIILIGPVLFAGPSGWAHTGEGIRNLGLHTHHQFWGFLGALIACVGGALMILGLFFRLGVLLVLGITVVHLLGVGNFHTHLGDIELAVMLVGLLFVGPGKYSVDKN